MKKKTIYIITIAIILVLIVFAGTIGYMVWVQSTYQTQEAEEFVNKAMVDYSDIVGSTNAAGESIKNITSELSYEETGSPAMTPESIDKARQNLSKAKECLSRARMNLDDYNTNLASANALKVGDNYNSYLILVGKSGDSTTLYIQEMEAALIIIEQILNAYNCGQQISVVQLDQFSVESDYYNALINKINAENAMLAAETILFGNGVLDKSHEDVDQFFAGCNVKLTVYADAVKAQQHDQAAILFVDYQNSCSGDIYANNTQIREATWSTCMQSYFTNLVIRLNELQCNTRQSIEDAQKVHRT